MSTNAATMETERAEKVAAARKQIDAADKVKIAKANKEAKANAAKVTKATAERKAKEAAKPATPAKKRVTPAAEKRMTDAELLAAVKKVATDGMTRSGAVKAFRAAGHSAAGKRIREAFDAATAKPKSKATKKSK